MNIQIYNSVEGGAFFRKLIDEWTLECDFVELHKAVSESEYRGAKGTWSRLSIRWRMYGRFAFSSWRLARERNGTKIIRLVTTNPFFLPALVARFSVGRGATINLLYDLYPEALIQAGKIKSGSLIACFCGSITRYALRECDATVFLGEHLKEYIELSYGKARRSVIIPVGADGSFFKNCAPKPIERRPTILYCGQMGRMHDVDTISGIWAYPESRDCRWVFHASGTGYQKFRDTVAQETGGNVVCGDPLTDSSWVETMSSAEVALVTIARGAERVVMPSKTYSALVAGQAVLAICPTKSDLADLVLNHDCGWVVEPGDIAGLRTVLHEIASNPEGLQGKRERAFAAGHKFYDSAVVAKQWLALFIDLARQPTA